MKKSRCVCWNEWRSRVRGSDSQLAVLRTIQFPDGGGVFGQAFAALGRQLVDGTFDVFEPAIVVGAHQAGGGWNISLFCNGSSLRCSVLAKIFGAPQGILWVSRDACDFSLAAKIRITDPELKLPQQATGGFGSFMGGIGARARMGLYARRFASF